MILPLAMFASFTLDSTASAAVTAFVSEPIGPATTRTDTFPQAGFGFYATTSGTEQVNRLGFWVSPDNAGGQLAIDHDIALYNYNGTDYTQIAGATVLAGATADANGYAWVSIPAITLTDDRPDADYYIVMASVGTDIWAPNTGSANVFTAEPSFGTRTNNGWYSNNASPGVGSTATFIPQIGNGGYYGPNIGFEAVPEPSVALLGGLGLLALLRRRR